MNKYHSFDNKKRLDHLAVHQYSHLSRTKIKSLIKKGHLKINGVICTDPSYKIVPTANITLSEQEIQKDVQQNIQEKPLRYILHIIFEDEHIVIINKSAGIVVHPAPGYQKDTLIDQLNTFYNLLLIDNQSLTLKLVHRLDKDTSGLLLVAKTEFAYLHLKAQFMNRSIKRYYYAFVIGVITPPIGKICTTIGRHPINRKKMSVIRNGKLAITHYYTKKKFGSQASLLECTLETGRTHQIRVHFNYLKHPLIGDQTYGRKNFYPLARQALHAYKIQFIHPRTNQTIVYEVPLPDDLQLLHQDLELTYGIK